MKTRWQDLKPGDRAVLDFGGPLEAVSLSYGGVWLKKPNVQPFVVPSSLCVHISFTLEARPLAVGDKVVFRSTPKCTPMKVLALDATHAWVRVLSYQDEDYDTVPLSRLERIS